MSLEKTPETAAQLIRRFVIEVREKIINKQSDRHFEARIFEQFAIVYSIIIRKIFIFQDCSSRSIVLLCRNQDDRWAHNNVTNLLLDLLKECNQEGAELEGNPLLSWVVHTLGMVKAQNNDVVDV